MFLCEYTHLEADFTRLNVPYPYKKHNLKNFQGNFLLNTMEKSSGPFSPD